MNLENLSKLERRVSITVPRSQIEKNVEERLKKMASNIKMDGFRPGKVPLKLVAQQYGAQIRTEVINDVVPKLFYEMVDDQKLKVAGYPKIETKNNSGDTDIYEFSAVFEIYPEITIGDLTQVTIERPSIEVGEVELDKTLELLRKQRVKYLKVERAAQHADRVTVDFEGKLDGVAFPGGDAKSFSFVIGEGRLLPDFENNTIGINTGENKSFPVTFPADYQNKELAGKTAVFNVTVKQIEEPKLPDLDQDFAKSLGISQGDLGTIRAEVLKNVKLEVKKRIQARLTEQVMQTLIANSQLELPKSLVNAEMNRLMYSAGQNLRRRGVKEEHIQLSPELFEDQAKRRVSLGLIVGELIKLHNLQDQPEQVRALVEEQAQTYERPEEVVTWYYAQTERLNQIKALAVEDNVVSWVLGQVKVVDKPISFDELMA